MCRHCCSSSSSSSFDSGVLRFGTLWALALILLWGSGVTTCSVFRSSSPLFWVRGDHVAYFWLLLLVSGSEVIMCPFCSLLLLGSGAGAAGSPRCDFWKVSSSVWLRGWNYGVTMCLIFRSSSSSSIWVLIKLVRRARPCLRKAHWGPTGTGARGGLTWSPLGLKEGSLGAHVFVNACSLNAMFGSSWTRVRWVSARERRLSRPLSSSSCTCGVRVMFGLCSGCLGCSGCVRVFVFRCVRACLCSCSWTRSSGCVRVFGNSGISERVFGCVRCVF